jgi:hypothetical protein
MSILKRVSLLLISTILIISCAKENQFIIEKGKVGLINNETTVKEIKELFKNDSIVAPKADTLKNLFSFSSEEFLVFSKEGKKIIEITPTVAGDSVSKIKSVQIFDSNYKTDKGLSLSSTFREINENYMVNKVETTLSSATLFIDELNATIAIDKKELGLNPFSREEITLEQIPDIAKIKYFTIWFN